MQKFKKYNRSYSYDKRNPPLSIPIEEKPKGPFESCGNCNLASHGFFCFSSEGDCLKTQILKQNQKE